MKSGRVTTWLWTAISIALFSTDAAAQNPKQLDVDKARVIQYWTKERRANAIPRDLVIDPRGLGYLKRPDGSLLPYGHDTAAQGTPKIPVVWPFAGPTARSDETSRPTVSYMDPLGTTIGSSYTFKATVTDATGVNSVTFNIQKNGSSFVNSFSANNSGGDVWTFSVKGFTDGAWRWWVLAKDGTPRSGHRKASDPVSFTVDSRGGGDSGAGGSRGATVANEWTAGGPVQTAVGRLYFEMPNNSKRKGPWTGYVCSGTVAADGIPGRSLIMTAAHCVYDDVNKAFARNVMFIPDQTNTKGSGTDLNCSNDPIGCWISSFGVVDINWTTTTFPNNIEWDYAFYVVKDAGAHQPGAQASSDGLDTAADSLRISFGAVTVDDGTTRAASLDFTHALGYSYNEDPEFMYCAEDMTTEGAVNWWLPSCGLFGGSSGGPWVQPMNNAESGPIISVSSWGYTNSAGMAGPKLVSPVSSAYCVFARARTTKFEQVVSTDGDAGKAVTCR